MARVIVIDDDEAVRETLGRTLAACGHQIEAHRMGVHGLAAHYAQRAAVLVVDLVLPGMSGVEVIQNLRHFIAISGAALADEPQNARYSSAAARAAGAAAEVLAKPFRADDLAGAVARLATAGDARPPSFAA